MSQGEDAVLPALATLLLSGFLSLTLHSTKHHDSVCELCDAQGSGHWAALAFGGTIPMGAPQAGSVARCLRHKHTGAGKRC